MIIRQRQKKKDIAAELNYLTRAGVVEQMQDLRVQTEKENSGNYMKN